MTREEAINRLRDMIIEIRTYCDESKHMGEDDRQDMKTFDMAIKALEQEPCEDCISREDAIMCMTGEYVADMTYKPEDIISKHIQRLRALPPVTPQKPIRPKGKWISYHYGAYYECSNCHERNNSKYDKYCKFCGAEMEGSEE